MMMNYQHHVEIEEAIDDENENEKKSAGGGGGGVVMVEREHMFDKVVTPSDVGKLNRLVIPKQHAEKYFPLDSSNNEKGLLLNFEDGTGKPWRFRYSYWNSSQSYVMTKGWSRFVKEKKLDAGDIVSFQRGVGVGEFGKDKLFIDWRRRPDHNHHHIGSSYNLPHHAHAFLPHHHHHNQFYHHSVSHGRAPTPPTFVLRSHPYPHPNSYPYPQQQQPGLIRRPGSGGVGSGYYGYGSVVNPYPVTGSLIFLRSTTSSSGGMTTTTGMMNTTTHQVDEEEEGEETLQNVYESVPVVQGKAASKRLRLFGVNMECTTTPPISHQTHDFDILSSALASSSSSSSSINHHHHHHTSTSTQISMGPPPSTTPTSSTSLPLQLRSFFNGTSSSSPSAKGKSSNTSSSSMSLDLDI